MVFTIQRSEPDESSGSKHGVTNFGVVYVNEVGRAAMFSTPAGRFPVGSIIVREKLSQPNASPELLAVMIKHASGFNSKGGDWEFLTLEGNAGKVKNRQKTGECLECHSKQSDKDFVVRTYLR